MPSKYATIVFQARRGCLATAAVLVTFAAKSDIRKDRDFGTFGVQRYTN